MSALYRSFTSLDWTERMRVVEAATLMLLVWTGLRVLRFSSLGRLLDRYARLFPATDSAQGTILRSVHSLVNGVATRLPGKHNCLVRALVAHTILRRHGLASELKIGVRRTSTSPLEAHA